jgi:hypothetical protein
MESLKETLRKQHGAGNQGNVECLGGYSGMGSSEKNNRRAFDETDFSGFSPNLLIVVNKDRKRCKKVK